MWFRSSKPLTLSLQIDVLESLSAQLHLAKHWCKIIQAVSHNSNTIQFFSVLFHPTLVPSKSSFYPKLKSHNYKQSIKTKGMTSYDHWHTVLPHVHQLQNFSHLKLDFGKTTSPADHWWSHFCTSLSAAFFFDLKLHEAQPLQEHWNPPEVRIKCTEIWMLGIACQKSFLSWWDILKFLLTVS